MGECLSLAHRGFGRTSPNPMVGALVLSPEGEVVGRGFHRFYGGLHAEEEALSMAGSRARGGILFVNLEPCSHWGRRPPCAGLVVESGIARAFVGTLDPNPVVAGKGVELLRSGGVEVCVGVLEEECRRLNEGFFCRFERGRPAVWLKAASSLDGKVALRGGESRWVTSFEARRYGHLLRSMVDAVLVGVSTVLIDDPELSNREVDGPSPRPVVLDFHLRVPTSARCLRRGALVYHCEGEIDRERELRSRGVLAVRVGGEGGRVRLEEVLSDLLRRGVNLVLVEGGGRVLSSFLESGFYDRLFLFQAPKLMGEGISFSSDLSFGSMEEVVGLGLVSARRVGEDLLLELSGPGRPLMGGGKPCSPA